MRFLDLFAGIGGFTLGLEAAGMTCAGHAEVEPYCREMLAKHWPGVPLWGDVKQLRGEDVGYVDLVCGGPPCQPASLAGKRKGAADDRWLWPEALRLVAEIGPAWCLFENPAGIRTMGLDGVLAELEGQGYACQTLDIPACAVDAPHRRHRLWILAHAEDVRRPALERSAADGALRSVPGGPLAHAEGESPRPAGQPWQGRDVGDADGGAAGRLAGGLPGAQAQGAGGGEATRRVSDGPGHAGRALGDADQLGPQGWRLDAGEHAGQRSAGAPGAALPDWSDAEWLFCADEKWRRVKPGIQLLAHGIPRRIPKLKALGNAVVARVAYEIGRAIVEAHHE